MYFLLLFFSFLYFYFFHFYFLYFSFFTFHQRLHAWTSTFSHSPRRNIERLSICWHQSSRQLHQTSWTLITNIKTSEESIDINIQKIREKEKTSKEERLLIYIKVKECKRRHRPWLPTVLLTLCTHPYGDEAVGRGTWSGPLPLELPNPPPCLSAIAKRSLTFINFQYHSLILLYINIHSS